MNLTRRILPALIVAIVTVTLFAAAATIRITDVHAAKDNDKFFHFDTFSQALDNIENYYVEETDSRELIYGAIKGMLNDLDPHSTFYTPEQFREFQNDTKGEFGGLGITIGIRDKALTVIAPIEGTPADKAGLKSGDVIIKIDGKSSLDLTVEEAVTRLRGEPGDPVTITIVRQGKDAPFDVTIVRDTINIPVIKSRVIDDSIGYIRLVQFTEKASDEVRKALTGFPKKNVRGLILDLRRNPGGLLSEAIDVSSLFLPSGSVVVSTRDRSQRESSYKSSRLAYKDTDTPLVVLVNEGSASASEIVAGALQDHKRAVIMGTTTFGKASVQTLITLNDGSAIKLTTARYYTPDGRSIQSVGITPDIVVANGTITYDDNSNAITERDLEQHLVGENESGDANNEDSDKPEVDDLQLQSAVNLLKGLITYVDKKAQ